MVIKVDIQKSLGSGQNYWTNRYLLDYDDPSEVPTVERNGLVSGERAMHGTGVSFVSMRVSDMVEGTDNYIIYPLTGTGGTAPGGNTLPGWVTVRVDFGYGIGRPGRKYFRTYVGEAQQNGNVWEATYFADVQTLMDTLLNTVPTICSPDGARISSVVPKNLLQMRQLRRGTRKKDTPIIPIAP